MKSMSASVCASNRLFQPNFLALAALSAGLAGSSALASGQATPPTGSEGSKSDGAKSRIAADIAKVLEKYIIAPEAAMKLGCRVKWQTIASVPEGGSLKLLQSSEDGVLALNNRNELSLIRPDTGDRAWVASAADPLDRIIGMGVVTSPSRGSIESGRVAILTDAVYYSMGLDSGGTLHRTRYHHVPSTGARQFGSLFLYGTTSGNLTWFNTLTSNDARSHMIDAIQGGSPVRCAPTIGKGVVVAGSSAGGVVALDVASGDFRWKKTLLAGVAASPAIGDKAAFVASEDQYLYAFDLQSGATLWKYFTQSPLTTSPFATGDLVLQDIPGEGLVAFSQSPESKPGGEVRWRREPVMGTPMCTLDGAVGFWCPKCRKITFVSLKDGQTVRTVDLPAVEHIEADTIEPGGFIAWNSDGRIERLTPMTQSASADQK